MRYECASQTKSSMQTAMRSIATVELGSNDNSLKEQAARCILSMTAEALLTQLAYVGMDFKAMPETCFVQRLRQQIMQFASRTATLTECQNLEDDILGLEASSATMDLLAEVIAFDGPRNVAFSICSAM